MTILNEKSQAIVDALSSVNCGQDVFEALCQAPTSNLMDMRAMIKYILEQREEDYTWTHQNTTTENLG